MSWKDIAHLVTIKKTTNEIGDTIRQRTKRKVFVNRQSIRQSEFYQAQATGLRPEISFEIRTIEYDNESIIEYNSKEYDIIRTFIKGDFIELICQGVVNNGNA